MSYNIKKSIQICEEDNVELGFNESIECLIRLYKVFKGHR